MPKKVENPVLFLRFRLPSTLIRHENGAFRKLSLNRRIWKRWLVVFLSTENILRTELCENDDVMKITWFPRPSFPPIQIQNDQWLLCFMLLQLSVGAKLKHLIRFHGVKSRFFSNFLCRAYGRALKYAARESSIITSPALEKPLYM